jgi:hypothetical protein
MSESIVFAAGKSYIARKPFTSCKTYAIRMLL